MLVAIFAAVATGVGVLMGTVFRTDDQAISVGPPLGIAMGMLGGCMWPLAIVPEVMRSFGHLFPHAWAMDAFIKLIGGGGAIWRELAVLTGFAAVLLAASTWRLRRSL